VYLGNGQELILGETLAVQPFKKLSQRDFGRPSRDDYSGMLPPKLAQMMINLARGLHDEILLDPFCGSGTIITEAMLLGYTDLIGSDISPKAIADSNKNVEWMKKNFNLKMNPTLEVQDALRLSSLHRGATIGAIVTETYLGPQRGKVDIKKVSSELQTLYSEVLKECFRILKPGRRVVMAIPAFNGGKQTIKLTVPAGFMQKDSFLYGRAGQGVFRQILVLEKR
jgi:tRNA G10  N-methylase Trm11